MGWRSPGRAEQSIIDKAEALTRLREALSRVSEALGRRVGWPSDAGSSVLSRESARSIPARPVHSSRVAIKPAAMVKTYALRVASGRSPCWLSRLMLFAQMRRSVVTGP